MPARPLIEAALAEARGIRFGWVRGEHVVEAPFRDGEDDHHMAQNHLLPDEQVHEWKRWRYNSDLSTVFWWEAPTAEERDSVKLELRAGGHWVRQNVFVELNSSPAGDRDRAKKVMPTANLFDLEQSDDAIEHGAGADLLDVTHYPGARTDYVERWLRTVGD